MLLFFVAAYHCTLLLVFCLIIVFTRRENKEIQNPDATQDKRTFHDLKHELSNYR